MSDGGCREMEANEIEALLEFRKEKLAKWDVDVVEWQKKNLFTREELEEQLKFQAERRTELAIQAGMIPVWSCRSTRDERLPVEGRPVYSRRKQAEEVKEVLLQYGLGGLIVVKRAQGFQVVPESGYAREFDFVGKDHASVFTTRKLAVATAKHERTRNPDRLYKVYLVKPENVHDHVSMIDFPIWKGRR